MQSRLVAVEVPISRARAVVKVRSFGSGLSLGLGGHLAVQPLLPCFPLKASFPCVPAKGPFP
jgi:hypothetical protein